MGAAVVFSFRLTDGSVEITRGSLEAGGVLTDPDPDPSLEWFSGFRVPMKA